MRQIRNRKPITSLKFPLIKQKISPLVSVPNGKSIKLERIGQKKNLALIDLAKINKIQKQFTIMTKRNNSIQDQKPKKNDQMRQSRLLLLKDKSPAPNKRNNNQNLLSNLVMYHPPESNKKKKINIPHSNISTSPTKIKKIQKPKTAEQMPFQYSNGHLLEKLDFVKMFIVEELLYYINKTAERSKQEMVGFCKFYNENVDDQTYIIISNVLNRSKDFLNAVFYQKLGFYIFLILGTDADLQEEANFLLKSLTGYLHTNNLIILDILMEIVDIQKLPISSQFHVYNTSRFNEDRRKLSNKSDKMGLLAKNNKSSVELIKSILINCGFDSLKTFVVEILANNNIEMIEKIKQVSMMLVSLDSILVSSLHHTSQANKPEPPFLPEKEKQTPYTLVLDMDQTLIHYTQSNKNGALLIRPYCYQFLEELSHYYELVIFTAAVKEYADSILDSIDKKGLLSHRLYRQHTRIQDYVSIKDISLINRDLSKSIIIDNIASNFKLQPRNGIAISTWTGDTQDLSLLNLIPVLIKLARSEVKDVRDGLQMLSQYMQTKMTAGEQINFDEVNLSGL